MSKETQVNNLIINKLTKAQYESATKSDTELYFVTDETTSISDVSGLQTALNNKQDAITSSNKLSADLILDGSTNKTVTGTEKDTWNAKSNFSGSYNDLTNKPTIPTVNNATLTIQKNGTNIQTFTANQNTNATANITVPTNVSELTNDSGYTSNTGTITGITMNGASKGTSGVVDLGTVITEHQSLKTINNESILGEGNIEISSGSTTTTSYDSTNKRLIFTLGGQ